jgi:hypothetical protein
MLDVAYALEPALSLEGAGKAPWSPVASEVSTYALWSAARGDLITAPSGPVQAWVDATANAYSLTQAVSGNRPVLGVTSNGKPGVIFTKASSHRLLHTGLGDLPIDDDPCEIWIAGEQTSSPSDTSIMSLFEYGGGSNAYRRAERVVASGVNRAGARIGTGAAASAVTNSSVDFSGAYVLRIPVAATSSRVDVNGQVGGASSILPATAAGNMIMGMTNSGSAPLSGIVCALWITPPISEELAALNLAWGKAQVGLA